MNEISVALYLTLTGGTALAQMLSTPTSVYEILPPDNAILPYVVFSLQAGVVENTDPSDRRDFTYYIRGYAYSGKEAQEIDAQISELLHKQPIVVNGWNVIWWVREAHIILSERERSEAPVFNAGGLYRIRISKVIGG